MTWFWLAGALVSGAAFLLLAQRAGRALRSARRRAWEREHPGLKWEDWKHVHGG